MAANGQAANHKQAEQETDPGMYSDGVDNADSHDNLLGLNPSDIASLTIGGAVANEETDNAKELKMNQPISSLHSRLWT